MKCYTYNCWYTSTIIVSITYVTMHVSSSTRLCYEYPHATYVSWYNFNLSKGNQYLLYPACLPCCHVHSHLAGLIMWNSTASICIKVGDLRVTWLLWEHLLVHVTGCHGNNYTNMSFEHCAVHMHWSTILFNVSAISWDPCDSHASISFKTKVTHKVCNCKECKIMEQCTLVHGSKR